MRSLAQTVTDHREAIEYDLLTKTGHTIDDIGRTLSWDALDSFFTCIGPDSAIIKKLFPEEAEWNTIQKTNKILADIFDVLAQINANLVGFAERKPAKKPKPYKRPGQTPPPEEKHFGKDALPANELHEWFEKKRKKACQK